MPAGYPVPVFSRLSGAGVRGVGVRGVGVRQLRVWLVRMRYEDGVVHKVHFEYLQSLVVPSSSPWTAPPERVVSAEVQKGEQSFSRLRMIGTMSTGRVVELFRWYADELYFTPQDVVGKTKEQAQALFHDRDVAYLQS